MEAPSNTEGSRVIHTTPQYHIQAAQCANKSRGVLLSLSVPMKSLWLPFAQASQETTILSFYRHETFE